MHADGVRLFVECGPRGNLTSFVQDILRGRPFEAVAANVAHRSGLTQLNHMAAVLAAHHVPLRFEHMYSRRDPRPIAWKPSPVVGWVELARPTGGGVGLASSTHPTATVPPAHLAPPSCSNTSASWSSSWTRSARSWSSSSPAGAALGR